MLPIPQSWAAALGDELHKPYIAELEAFVAAERAAGPVYPPEEQVFSALERTSYEQTRVLILGQDPYHGEGQAHGLSFSVRPGVPLPPSLVNIYKELRQDTGVAPLATGSLLPWADQGVLLLNAVLTVREAQPNSHKGRGWERLTDAVIAALSRRDRPVVFVLWGAYARKKRALIDASRHTIIESAHPSPLSAHNGFFGSRPFSQIDAALSRLGEPPIAWS